MYTQTTRSIRVSVEPSYRDEHSDPLDRRFLWAYRIEISNEGQDTVRLLTRHWRITDALGRVQEFIGEGVVGEQPLLGPGEAFEYTSSVPLSTPSGIMTGTYGMQTAKGERFDVAIPLFSLDSPHQLGPLN